jgi:4-amino-4-deoxy-L-arabinose transferase-like glycosyltransferase
MYKLREFIIFLGDEGRDALVVKRMIVDHKFTLLGPTASVGGFYLGPVYYYFMIPFLWLYNFDPVGPAAMVAILGTMTVGLLYWAMKEWSSKTTAFIIAFLYATAPGIVSTSRSSWNPNIMPFFSLLSIFSLSQALTKKKNLWFIFAGISYGIAIQSHYLGLVIGPILALATLINQPVKKWLKSGFLQVIGFFIGGSMYFAFEIRHNFPNIKSVLEFVMRGGNTTGPRSLNLVWLYFEMYRRNFESVLPNFVQLTQLISLITVLGFFVYLLRKKRKFGKLATSTKVVLIWMLVGLLGIGSYKGQLYPHYFGYLFPLPFIIIGFTIESFSKHRIFNYLAVSLTAAAVVFNIISLPIWKEGSNLVAQTKNVSDQIIKMTENENFNYALISSGNSDHAYRYFLEISEYKPLTLEEEVTEQLIVVCEEYDDPCMPLGHPLWEIAGFGRAEIVDEVVVDPGIQIIKLIHHPDSFDLIGKPVPKG